VTDQVGAAVPSQASGSPVGPTGGDKPQAWAARARAAIAIAANAMATTSLDDDM
jgi:hypothetical protein